MIPPCQLAADSVVDARVVPGGLRKVWTASLCLVLAPLSACGLHQPPGDQGVADRIAAAVERGEGSRLDMAEAAPFRWDRFCAFPPYTTPQVAERGLGFRWRYAWSRVDMRDDRTYFVFADRNRVVAAFDHPRQRGDFADVDPSCVGRAQARFVVVETGVSTAGEPWRELQRGD